jgi:hypothetical protein
MKLAAVLRFFHCPLLQSFFDLHSPTFISYWRSFLHKDLKLHNGNRILQGSHRSWSLQRACIVLFSAMVASLADRNSQQCVCGPCTNCKPGLVRDPTAWFRYSIPSRSKPLGEGCFANVSHKLHTVWWRVYDELSIHYQDMDGLKPKRSGSSIKTSNYSDSS